MTRSFAGFDGDVPPEAVDNVIMVLDVLQENTRVLGADL